ncbi:GDSL esterase/lipase At1g33811-like [Magnolia sinica]|uniref:GDSL esterase/lipase At1g33811-like n=1 Tax=Magnolia sinica TaxID=86752 RepID=UPI00265A9C6B|nr:GDSL esterase/lipase At1g33811-like [Magnolia sinica]
MQLLWGYPTLKMKGFSDLILAILSLFWAVVRVGSDPQVPCLFIFGDSLVDNGNNNGMITLARANYMPYGMDFSQGVTGRFSNGRTFVDVLAQLLGFPDFIPPFASTSGPAVLRGLNYGSGAAGIRGETGNNLGGHVSMDEQIGNFGRTLEEIRIYFGGNNYAVQAYLSKCIFFSGMGSNDYLNNYFMPNYYRSTSDYSPSTFATVLIQDYSRQLTQLYNMGARKVVVTGLGRIGCIPYEMARLNNNRNRNSSRCNESINNAILQFNSGLRRMVDRFNGGQLPGAKFVYVDSYQSSNDLVVNAASYGFEVVDKACCGVGRNNGVITCLPLQQPCNDRRKYSFWDSFHPSEAANIIIANKSYSSKSRADVYPMNIQQLAMA